MWQAVFAFAGDPELSSDAVAEAFTQALRGGDVMRSTERRLWWTVFRIAAEELEARRHVGPDVVLRHPAGYPAKEIARTTGSTTPAVHVQLSRARKRLRELLEADDAEPRRSLQRPDEGSPPRGLAGPQRAGDPGPCSTAPSPPASGDGRSRLRGRGRGLRLRIRAFRTERRETPSAAVRNGVIALARGGPQSGL